MRLFRNSRRRQVPPASIELPQRVLASKLFDGTWYRETYPDVAGFPLGPLAHFCEHGVHERRDPGPNFDTRRYLAAVPEAGDGPLPPFLRALAEGEAEEGRPSWLRDDPDLLGYLLRASGLFDEAWYRAAYPDVARSDHAALTHYLDYGAAELRDPGPGFDSEHYALRYPDYRKTFPSPIEHYLRLGLRRGHSPTGLSRYGRWLAVHDDLTAADLERIAADAGQAPSSVLCIHVVDARTAARIDGLVEALARQVGATWRARFLRGPDVGAADWTACVARLANEPRIACAEDPAGILADCADGGIVLLGAEICRLRPHALHAFAQALSHVQAPSQAKPDAAYCDHDRIDGAGTRRAPVFKPAMSPRFMQRVPYAGPVIALRIGRRTRDGLALALAACADPRRAWADLLLGLEPARVLRIPLVLYHLPDDGRAPAPRTNQPVPDPHRTVPPHPDIPSGPPPSVRIVIPTRDRHTILKACIDSILTRTDYPCDRYGIVIVDNGSVEAETAAYLAQAVRDPRVAVLAAPGAFNFARICNDGAAGAEAEILVFLNNDTTVRQADWLGTLVAHARQPEVGAVGAQLLYPDDTVQHGGVVLGVDGVGAHALVELPAETARVLDATREMSAVTGACLAIRRALFEELGGFDPLLRIDFNDVDLCCAAIEAGYRNLYVAKPLLHHHESLSRGAEDGRGRRARNAREAILVRRRHAGLIRDDPSYNPNLSLVRIGALAEPPRTVPPWRRPTGDRRRILILSGVHEAGAGIAGTVAEQAAAFRARGWEVVVGGPEGARDATYPGCRRAGLDDATAAAVFATREGVDAVVAHTAPFFSVTRHLGRRPLVYLVDHGDPPPGLFPDREAREDAILEKRFCAAAAKRVFATSPTARDALFGQEAILLREPPVAPEAWSETWAARRPALRRDFGFTDRFVVLTLCRMGAAERPCNGFDDYLGLAGEHPFTNRALAGRVVFVAADRGRPDYRADIAPPDLTILGDLGDADLAALCAASDLYVTMQPWQGPGCGIAPALAMGLPVVASDIAAHRALPVETAADLPDLCALVTRHAERRLSGDVLRRAATVQAEAPPPRLADTIALDLERDSAEHWL